MTETTTEIEPGRRGGKRTAARRLTGEHPRRSTKELRDPREVLIGEIERCLQTGVRISTLARVSGVSRQTIGEILRGNKPLVTLGTHGDLLEGVLKIIYEEVRLKPSDYRAPVTVAQRPRDMHDTCARGHEQTDENTYVSPKGVRNCEICRAEARKRWREREKVKAAKLRADRKKRAADQRARYAARIGS